MNLTRVFNALCKNSCVVLQTTKTSYVQNSQKCRHIHRNNTSFQNSNDKNNQRILKQNRLKSTLYYVTTVGVVCAGLTYAAVPLYRIFCQASGYGGTTQDNTDSDKVVGLTKVKHRPVTVRFNSDVSASMVWKFKPQQTEIQVVPGETALAFYTATNPTDKAITGVSTYNVVPFEAGQYFNKIQCFCFEEQQLNPHEQVDMPVFFYIDPEFADDPKMELVNDIVLSYTFFEAREGMKLPIPQYLRRK